MKEFLNDNSGRLILPSNGKTYNNEDLFEYNNLKLNTSVKTMNKNDLPKGFSQEAIELVNEFHQKTIDEEIEWLLYFDYITGEILYCFKGDDIENTIESYLLNKIDTKLNNIDLIINKMEYE